MARFLRRSASTDQPAEDKNEEQPQPAVRSQTPAEASRKKPAMNSLVEPPTRAPSRRGGRRRSSGGNGSSSATAPTAAPNKPSGRRGSRRGSQETLPTDPTEKMLALLERQTALLEQQGKTIERLAESQTLLTETLLGQRGEDAIPARIEVLPRLAIFVDVPNILYGAESSGVRLNWGKVADFLSHGRTLVRAIAYAPISDDPTARTENERFVVPFLDHGYRIATKPLKRFTGGSVKANFDVELAIDVLTMSDRVDVIVLVSGDGDFRRLVEIVGARGVRVEVMAFGKSTSSDLRQVADRYIDIAQYADQLRD
ncbi:MAG: NYN domain-containing protein [Chloroflexi bacterium]|nr:NYN domain-containing protein [Chloroflexota bacterium]MYC02683.1 NYN domain-containing protein [Chloroflexota bacterium]MYD53838.1 NYN domain-containing protein [Chloroflexota bacterium]MYD72845.1 NYN domain-containing protein [Chloroflexota bacterium]